MKNLKLTISKDVLKKDYYWLKRDFKKGEQVTMYTGSTHDCIGKTGVTYTSNGKLPFFELPETYLSITYVDKEYEIFMAERGWGYRIFYCKEFLIDHMELLTKIQSNAESAKSKPISQEQKKENEILKLLIKDGEVTYEIIQLEIIASLF